MFRCDMNKMTAANLAVVFGPNLAWSNDKTMVSPLFCCGCNRLILVLYSFEYKSIYAVIFLCITC